mmetsp:Transcript_3479/g.2947  ORF Transcript_3479/g.2947 Transcript_3479/m.2947 type:complete len:110 (+) Transcript_3479:384-713(+)
MEDSGLPLTLRRPSRNKHKIGFTEGLQNTSLLKQSSSNFLAPIMASSNTEINTNQTNFQTSRLGKTDTQDGPQTARRSLSKKRRVDKIKFKKDQLTVGGNFEVLKSRFK